MYKLLSNTPHFPNEGVCAEILQKSGLDEKIFDSLVSEARYDDSLTVFLLAHPLQVDGSVIFGIVIDVVYGGFLFGIIVLTKLTCHKSAY